VFYLLEDRIEQVWLLNARDVKNVPGRAEDGLVDRTTAGISGRVRAERGSAG
jgi:hypothetical protein